MSAKLRFHVVYFSSEDDEYPASELNAHSPQTRGWQTFRYCEYPQELGFEFDNGVAKVSQIQILSHQSKIATKIEIFVGNGTDYHSARFKRLGYLSLDNNERSGYQARELKTVYVEADARFVKLVVHQCFLNKYNMFNQVGIIAVNFLGTENPSAPKHVSPARGGANANKGAPLATSSDKGGAADLSVDLNLDPQTAKKLRMLEEAKHAAVEREDYATAKQIKLLEKDIKSLGAELAQLDIAKQQAVKSEDYDRAMMLKKETDGLRAEIEEKVRNIRMPGITDTVPTRPSGHTNHINPVDEMRVGGGRGGATASGAAPLSARAPYSARGPAHSGDDGQGDARYADEEFEEPPLPVRPARVARTDAAMDEDSTRYDEAPPRSGIASAPETLLPDGDRPIRPKAQPTYTDQDPLAGAAAPGASSGGNDAETFPPGQHPLQGIANFADLPVPESLQSKFREAADACGLISLVGEYRVRCLFSRTWALRDAAINKIDMMLKDFARQPGIDAVVNPLVLVLKTGLDDKIAQVFVSSGAFLDDFLNNLKGSSLSKSQIVPLMEPILKILVDKLADGTARIRDTSRSSIEAIAACPQVGPSVVAAHGMTATSKSTWRAILGRLQLLTDLVIAYGVGSKSGVSVDASMNFIKSVGAFSHSNGEVRDGAKDLVVAIQKHVGTDGVIDYLTDLRPKQLEEYQMAFSDGGMGGAGGKGSKANLPPAAEAKEAVRKGSAGGGDRQQSKRNSEAKPTNKVPASGVRSDAKSPQKSSHQHAGEAAGADDFTKCMFCGKTEPTWSEDLLDLHYWKECPLLSPCPACAQIVEIAGLPEHLLEECEHRQNFVPCDTTGLAIRKEDFAAWQESTACTPPPENSMYCPLCLTAIVDSDDMWRQHLLYACKRNNRSYSK